MTHGLAKCALTERRFLPKIRYIAWIPLKLDRVESGERTFIRATTARYRMRSIFPSKKILLAIRERSSRWNKRPTRFPGDRSQSAALPDASHPYSPVLAEKR